MITTTGFRQIENERRSFPVLNQSPAEALSDLINNELGFGGQITSLSLTSVTIVTGVRSDMTDTVNFQGSEEEMQNLVQVCSVFLAIDDNLALAGAAAQAISVTGGNTAILALATPLLVGGSRLNLALLLGLGITQEALLRTGASVSTRNLLAAIQLAQETGSPLEEIISLAL